MHTHPSRYQSIRLYHHRYLHVNPSSHVGNNHSMDPVRDILANIWITVSSTYFSHLDAASGCKVQSSNHHPLHQDQPTQWVVDPAFF